MIAAKMRDQARGVCRCAKRVSENVRGRGALLRPDAARSSADDLSGGTAEESESALRIADRMGCEARRSSNVPSFDPKLEAAALIKQSDAGVLPGGHEKHVVGAFFPGRCKSGPDDGASMPLSAMCRVRNNVRQQCVRLSAAHQVRNSR